MDMLTKEIINYTVDEGMILKVFVLFSFLELFESCFMWIVSIICMYSKETDLALSNYHLTQVLE